MQQKHPVLHQNTQTPYPGSNEEDVTAQANISVALPLSQQGQTSCIPAPEFDLPEHRFAKRFQHVFTEIQAEPSTEIHTKLYVCSSTFPWCIAIAPGAQISPGLGGTKTSTHDMAEAATYAWV